MSEPQTCPECGIAISDDPANTACPGCMLKMATAEATSDDSYAPTYVSSKGASQGFVPPSVEELDAKLSGLEVQELIGKGGMGAVYRARQTDLDRDVAVKILPREIQGDPGFGERFLREARTLAKLNHPSIVAVYDFGQVDSLAYFVMEFVDGVTLRDTIAAGNVKPEEALRIVPDLCDALQFAHEEGIVHRDIKPENILLDKRGRIKIADFGLAKLAKGDATDDENLTGTHQVMGTVKYMAPEQMTTSKDVDHRADIYSLGVIFYELLTGELPMGWFAPPSKKVGVDVRMDEVVLRALEAEPGRRYQHASEVKSAVKALSSADLASTPSEPVRSGAGGIRLHKLLDNTETHYRTLHHATFLAAFAMLPMMLVAMFWQSWLIAAVFAVLGTATMIYSVRIKKNLVWDATYKGHTIRLDCGGMWAEKIYLDDGLVQAGGIGVNMEFRSKIKAGDGLGDEIIIWFKAGFRSCRCRIEVEEQL